MQVFGTCRANLFMRSFADKIIVLTGIDIPGASLYELWAARGN